MIRLDRVGKTYPDGSVAVGELSLEIPRDEICILESMKMEIPVITDVPGVVRELHVEPEQTVQEGDLIALIDES